MARVGGVISETSFKFFIRFILYSRLELCSRRHLSTPENDKVYMLCNLSKPSLVRREGVRIQNCVVCMGPACTVPPERDKATLQRVPDLQNQ